jgi:hypothetical protein
LDKGDHLIEHALEVQWCIDADAFLFVVALKRDSVTRRSILSTVSAVYDPLGFLAPLILSIKRILQDMCKSGLEWDDQISEEHSEQYAKWIDNMSRLGKVCIGRCFQTPELTQVRTVKQLIAFSDASDYGYGAVVYLRISSATQTKVSFLIGKARLAPIRLSTRCTIPKLELAAAALASNLVQMMTNKVSTEINDVFFFTDSTTVLHFIKNETKRFPIFVANRVQSIRRTSSPNQWFYIQTSDNPDGASNSTTRSQCYGCPDNRRQRRY